MLHDLNFGKASVCMGEILALCIMSFTQHTETIVGSCISKYEFS